MKKLKKNLLIFFGELRTFEHVIPHLEGLDSVDIILSTWSESKRDDGLFLVDETLIKKLLPNIKQFHIVNHKDIPNIDDKSNSWKLYYHWKNAINNISNVSDYENVILHRCDLISNWDSILNLDIEEDMVHFHYKDKPYSEFAKRDEHNNFIFNPNAFWINDFYVFGKFDIIKKFVNLFVKDNYSYPHFPIWEVISENNIKIKNHVLKGFLVRDANIEFVNNFTLQNQKFNPIGLLTGPDY